MKSLCLALILGFLSTVAEASSTVCASPKIYYSYDKPAQDTPTRPGTIISTTMLSYEGKMLMKSTKVAGEGQPRPLSHEFSLEGDAEVIDSTGDTSAGTATFNQLAVVYKLSRANPAKKKEIAREMVLCKKSW